jgi:type I restriction enzyme S subunit
MYKDPSIMPEEEFTYIDVSAVSNKLYKITDSKRLLGKDAPGRARKEVKHGDTIYATVRPYLKRIAYISEEFDKEICSTGYCVLHPNVDFVEPKFVFQLMLTHRVNQYLKSLQVGTSYPAINDNDIYQMLIPFPTRNEQNKIANILSEVDAKIEKEEATKVELEQLKKGLMQVLLTGQIRVKVKA